MALKLLKFALVAVAVLSLFDGTEQTCRGRGKVPKDKQVEDVCSEPRNTTVKLQVPEGFAYVEPSFVRVNQCTGLYCGHRMHCLPEKDSITVHTYKVNAFKGNEKKCKRIPVEEHGACQCQCQDPKCKKNMIVEEDSCVCVCDPKERQKCEEQRRKGKAKVMWSTETCSCQCDNRQSSQCGTGEKFDMEQCECVRENSV